MGVLAVQAVRELVGLRPAHHASTCIQEQLDGGGGRACFVVRCEPFRAAEPGLAPGYVVDVLGAERKTGKRTVGRAFELGMGMPAESADRVALEDERHAAIIASARCATRRRRRSTLTTAREAASSLG